MPLIENTYDQCVFGSRFDFNRTQGPLMGLKNIGTMYLMDNVTLSPPIGLGVGGYLSPNPPRTFGFEWKGLARSTPAPLLLGTTSPYTLILTSLFYRGRTIEEVEDFIREAPTILGPYAGTLRHYRPDFTTVYRTYLNAYFVSMSHNFDGSKNFVEYDLNFQTVNEPS